METDASVLAVREKERGLLVGCGLQLPGDMLFVGCGVMADPDRTRDQEAVVRKWLGDVFVKGSHFQSFMACVILANAALIGLETDYPENALWDMLEDFLLFIFVGELSIKIIYLREDFFVKDVLWNSFDFLIVWGGVLDYSLGIFFPSLVEHFAGISSIMKMFRLLRILRLVRLFRMFKQLYLLASGFVDASVAVFWVTVLCTLMLYICAVMLTRSWGHAEASTFKSEEQAEFCRTHFGSIPGSMLTLFELMADPDVGRMGLVIDDHPGMLAFVILFIVFGSFAMLAILTGVISQSMLEKANALKDENRFMEEKKKKDFLASLREYFALSDTDNDGTLSREEFHGRLPEMVTMFAEAGFNFEAPDLNTVFDLVDFDHGNSIQLDEFLQGMSSFTAHSDDLPMGMMRLKFIAFGKIKKCENNLFSRLDRMSDKNNEMNQLLMSGQTWLDS